MIQVGQASNYSTETLKNQLSDGFRGFEVDTRPPLPDPSEAYDTVRGQYHSTRVLVFLEKHVNIMAAGRLLGVAAFDLYVPGMNFVFGEARCPGRVAVISTKRLKPSPLKDIQLFGERVHKEAVHEIGHMLGLRHCHNTTCVMYFSEQIQDTDRKNTSFCEECQVELERLKVG